MKAMAKEFRKYLIKLSNQILVHEEFSAIDILINNAYGNFPISIVDGVSLANKGARIRKKS